MSKQLDSVGLMKRALQLAVRGRGRVEPNPMVGCVLAKGGRILGEGYHRRLGGPHAEIVALDSCQTSPRGCEVYVTLEPCSHFGKTPPCSSALLEAGVGRVYAAMVDPGEHVRGRGLRQLRRAGVPAEAGLLEAEAQALNAPYLKLVRHRRPWVILKWAQSLDGKLATRTRRPANVSGAKSHELVHRWRGQMDGILVGIGTALADDPLLTARLTGSRRVAARIILDSGLRLPKASRLVQSAGEAPVIVACSKKAAGRSGKAAWLERQGCELLPLASRRGRISLEALLDELGRRKMTNLLVEGGGLVLGSFFDRRLADEARVFVSPTLIGGRDAPAALDGVGCEDWPAPPAGEPIQTRRVGQDLLYVMWLSRPYR